ncbi:MAG TPA: hypothetical protein ENI96_15100 [Sedimenticola thiotaurini]|uniref:Uncharacterized protein n=1 Tax=Sedimenticola thiotaurini TaxID=1543721 RepID=A0A831RN60_9GAMM|nr:hypothetical protein [Sedimenticola thiotaurini]
MIDATFRPLLPEPAADIEMLHTDVMRFMAILGLCLAAIFALVQSIPAEQAAEARAGHLQQALDQARLQLRRSGEELAAALERRQELERELAARRRRNQELQRSLGAAERKLEALARERSRIAATLEQARNEQRQERERLQRALADARQNASPPAPEQERPGRPQPLEMPEAGSDPAVTGREPVAPPSPSAEPRAEPVRTPPAGSDAQDRRGFVLRFASSSALEALVTAGRVRFLVLADGRAWSYRMQAGLPRLVADRTPLRYHEMAPQTVPDRFRRALAENGVRGEPVWAVVLPSALEQQLQRLTRGHAGGVLEIQASGRVRWQGKG